MPFSKSLAARVRQILTQRKRIVEKKMFGGIAFMLHGNMLVGIWNDSLIVRLGPEQGEKALSEPNVREFEVTGRPMKGWIMVEPDGIEDDAQLADWIERAVEYVVTLPTKYRMKATPVLGRSGILSPFIGAYLRVLTSSTSPICPVVLLVFGMAFAF